jgi:hypothetical protein
MERLDEPLEALGVRAYCGFAVQDPFTNSRHDLPSYEDILELLVLLDLRLLNPLSWRASRVFSNLSLQYEWTSVSARRQCITRGFARQHLYCRN